MHAVDIGEKLAAHGFDVEGSTPEQLGAFRRAEQTRWGRVVKEAGIQPQ